MDPSRICLTRINLSDTSYKFYKNIDVALNIGDLKDVLKCEANDRSKTTLQFGEETLFLAINSEKFGSTINRTLEYLDLELEEIPLENLTKIKYIFSFSLDQARFVYMMKNLGIYSEVIDISAKEQSVIFSEEGKHGKGEFVWKKKHLLEYQFNHEVIEEELQKEYSEETKAKLQTILDTKQCMSAHSLSFLTWIDKIAKVLGSKDTIQMSIRNDHPIRIIIQFPQLGNSSLLYYLAPRIPPEDYDEEDDDNLDDF